MEDLGHQIEMTRGIEGGLLSWAVASLSYRESRIFFSLIASAMAVLVLTLRGS